MLKSTHRPTAAEIAAQAPLPEGWTEHKAPTGHSYYYNAATKQSTYTRPAAPPPPPPPPQPLPHQPIADPSLSFLQYQSISDTNPNGTARGNFLQQGGRGGFTGRGDHDPQRPRGPQPIDKPKTKQPIPNCAPWILVNTKFGRRFVYNSEKNQSFWRIPDKLKAGILELDQQRIKEKAGTAVIGAKDGEEVLRGELPQAVSGAAERPGAPPRDQPVNGEHRDGDDSSEYEEVEVTDDEEEDDEENAAKRQRTEDEEPEAPIEFNEDDIAFQLAAMGADYDLDPGEYDDGNAENWAEGAEGLELSEEDAAALFMDLLNDNNINPYSPWDKVIESDAILDDTRYTALPTTKARKEVWESWSRDKIQELKARRAQEEKKDPRIPYMAFLQKHATPKLYWPEFKRKFKKEAEMKNSDLTDKEREKWYREHINRLKLPASQLKSDLLALLKAQPLSAINNTTSPDSLPSAVMADIRFISIEEKVRATMIEGYVSTLPPPPKDNGAQEESEEDKRKREEKERRERALRDREDKVDELKRKQRRQLEFGKGRLREEEAEIERAMNVGKKGLMSHFAEAEDNGEQ